MSLNLKAVFTAFIVFAFQRSVFAQASVESIVIPTTIAKETDIYFENGMQPPAGSITISPIETTISKTGDVSVKSRTATSPGSYMLTGQIGYLYAITLPVSYTVSNGGKYITAEKFTSYPATNGILDTRGMQMLKIGATFHVSDKQSTNNRNANTAQVTINYN
ncbi:MAG: hypothetical protein K0Q79_3711 [Flavipsychrobacter sp.]|jgi:hypothetical protein|nr:hypothetical protein [Flavipsychrobacter sp.]